MCRQRTRWAPTAAGQIWPVKQKVGCLSARQGTLVMELGGEKMINSCALITGNPWEPLMLLLTVQDFASRTRV